MGNVSATGIARLIFHDAYLTQWNLRYCGNRRANESSARGDYFSNREFL